MGGNKEKCPLTEVCYETWRDYYNDLDNTCEVRKALDSGELKPELAHFIEIKIFEGKDWRNRRGHG